MNDSNRANAERGVLATVRAHDADDAELLHRYAQRGDQSAFEALLQRHGPMVLGICRRVLRNSHDAEDAFQAAFLVLARKAAGLRAPAAVGNWLYGVAHRTALEARKRAGKRRAKEAQVIARPQPSSAAGGDLQALLDEELERLPGQYRAAVVLCDLQGQTRAEAARVLRCPEGAVAGRLARGRALLAKRLARRGVVLSGGSLGVLLASGAAAARVPAALTISTLQAAAGAASAAGPLAEGVLRAMFLAKCRRVLAVIGALFLGILAAMAAVQMVGLAGETATPVTPGAGQPTAPSQGGPKRGRAGKDGLALTVWLDRKSFGPDDEVVLHFALKNERDKVLYIGDGYLAPDYHETGPGRHFEVHVKAGGTAPLLFWSSMLTEGGTAGIRKVFRLRPGEEYQGSIRLSAGAANDARYAQRSQEQRGGSFEDKSSGKGHVLGKDGTMYTVELLYRVDPESHGVWKPPADFQEASLWKGAVTSAPLEFEITPGDKAHGRTDPPGVPLQGRLVAKKPTYALDLGGKTPEEFRKLLKSEVPPAPEVDLELEFRNSGDKELKFLVGGTNPDVPLLLKLEGDGATNLALRAFLSASDSQPPRVVALAPGKTYALPIKSLMTLRVGRDGSASYWTQPGEYSLTATFKTAVSPVPVGANDDGKGFGAVTVISAPVTLRVIAPKKDQAPD